MSLVISRVFTYDEDAGNYIQAVEGPAGDNQALEPAVRQAINNFVVGCKQDGIWDAIKASCILAGARTLNGALQPLVGTAPTNNNFVSGDYNRKTGLVGDGSTKYLNSNRNNNADPQDNRHVSIYATTSASFTQAYISGSSPANVNSAGTTALIATTTLLFSRIACGTATSIGTSVAGFAGASRSAAASYIGRNNATNTVISVASQTPPSINLFVFASNQASVPVLYTNARLAFYSIGESLDLALLDGRVTDLITAFGAAIP